MGWVVNATPRPLFRICGFYKNRPGEDPFFLSLVIKWYACCTVNQNGILKVKNALQKCVCCVRDGAICSVSGLGTSFVCLLRHGVNH